MVQHPDTSDRHEFRDFIDQTAKGTFTELGPKEMSELRGRHEKYTGAPVSGDARPSNLQLSALAHWTKEQSNGRMNSPFVEFATWGAFNGRSQKMRQFHAHVLTRDGTWQNKLLRGPNDLWGVDRKLEGIRGSIDYARHRDLWPAGALLWGH